jgi:hypothetical protein
MLLKRTRDNLQFAFIASAVLISLNFWAFRGLPDKAYRALEMLLYAGTVLVLLFSTYGKSRKTYFNSNAILFLTLPLLSVVGAWFFHQQHPALSLWVLRVNILWLLYFVLHKFNIPVERIIKLMVFTGIVWMLITIIQQFTFPNYLFYHDSEANPNSFYRLGVYRFRVYGHQYGTFVLLFFFYQYLHKRKLLHLGIVLLGLVALYYYGTRQFAISALICIVLSLGYVRGRARLYAGLLLLLGVPILFYYKDVLFAKYIEMTVQQLNNPESAREVSARFWFYEYWPTWLAKITGNGVPHIASEYGREMDILKYTMRLFRSDVGIIGAFSQFGIFYVLNILWCNMKGLRNKYLVNGSKYLNLIFINLIILLVTSEYYFNLMGIPFYCFIFYLYDKSWRPAPREVKIVSEPVKFNSAPYGR